MFALEGKFEIEITRLEGKLKLSQNRSLADQQTVVEALTRQGDRLGMEVAELMAKSGALDGAAPATAGTAITED